MLNTPRFSSPSSSAKGSTSSARIRCSSLTKSAILAAMAVGALAAGQAQAFVVKVDGQDWDVTTFTGSYPANISKFATAGLGGVMPWWGNSSLADQFAQAVGNGLGLPNFGVVGPFFGFSYVGHVTQNAVETYAYFNYDESVHQVGRPSDELDTAWAQATPFTSSAAPVPGPLPALGAAAAFGFSRKLRKRIKRSANSVSSSYSL
jgi:hypothetical protein